MCKLLFYHSDVPYTWKILWCINFYLFHGYFIVDPQLYTLSTCHMNATLLKMTIPIVLMARNSKLWVLLKEINSADNKAQEKEICSAC